MTIINKRNYLLPDYKKKSNNFFLLKIIINNNYQI
jgi:hypothetical protein